MKQMSSATCWGIQKLKIEKMAGGWWTQYHLEMDPGQSGSISRRKTVVKEMSHPLRIVMTAAFGTMTTLAGIGRTSFSLAR